MYIALFFVYLQPNGTTTKIRTLADYAIHAFDNRGSIYLFQSVLDGFKPVASISKKLGHEVAIMPNAICWCRRMFATPTSELITAISLCLLISRAMATII